MRMKNLLRLAAAMLVTISLAGCGGNSNTNGTVTLTAVAPPTGSGTVAFTASATVTPAAVGANVTFVATQYGYDKTSGGAYIEVERYAPPPVPMDKTGLAVIGHTFTQSQTMPTSILVTASCNGLSALPFTVPNIPIFVP